MNILKIESDFLKGLFGKESSKYIMTEYDGKVGYSDSYYIAFVPENDAHVRCERPGFNVKTIVDMEDPFPAEYKYQRNTKFGNIVRYDRVDGRGHAYIKEKYTKFFDKSAVYYVKDHKSPVHVYEKEELVGIICPVNIQEGVK